MSSINIYLKICLFISISIFVLNPTANSQSNNEGRVSISLDNSFSLVKTDQQKNILDKIIHRETTASVKIFKVHNITEIANSTELDFGINDEIIHSINYNVKSVNESTNLWRGKPDE